MRRFLTKGQNSAPLLVLLFDMLHQSALAADLPLGQLISSSLERVFTALEFKPDGRTLQFQPADKAMFKVSLVRIRN